MPTLEFTLDPGDVARLARWHGLRANRSFPADITWLDASGGALASEGLALSLRRGRYQLTRLRPPSAVQPPSVLAEAARPELLNHTLPPDLVPQARLHGRQQAFRLTEEGKPLIKLWLIEGRLGSHTVCRLMLDGPAADIATLALALAAALNVQVPRSGLAEQALAPAEGSKPRAIGAPHVPEGRPVTDTLSAITAHLTDVMLHWADQVPTARTPEAVHQMRVATRRLRSALSLYRSVAACPEMTALVIPLKSCAARLGTARDWDVFLGGIGARLAENFPEDARCSAMLRAAAARRLTSYAELQDFLTSADFRVLMAALACVAALRPWEGVAPENGLQQDTAVFAAEIMGGRLRAVRKAGRHIETLSIPDLHELRKKCKRLRYAAEFFAPLFVAKRARRFIRHLSELQEELGQLNDSAAASGLMAQLGRLERSYAAGLVEGFSAAGASHARTRINRAWRGFRQTAAFWPG